MDSEDQAGLRVMEVATLCSLPMALKAAIVLHVPDILADHGATGQDATHFLSASQIVSHFGDYPSLAPVTCAPFAASRSSSLDRILRVLASHGFLASSTLESADSPHAKPVATYALNPLTRHLLQSSGHNSLAPYLLLTLDAVSIKAFFNLHESVLDGTVPFTKAHGMDVFSFAQKDARFDQLFFRGMFGHTQLFIQDLLQAYAGFKDINSLVDVGGGIGASLGSITSKYPHIKGINFDLPHLIRSAPQYPGVEHVGGDMFVSIPKGEAIFLKWILHDWSDNHCLKIMENCYKALPSKGKVIVVDAIAPSKMEHDLTSRFTYQMDLLMFACTGGKERTKEELLSISKEVGFTRLQVICCIHGCSVVEIFKEEI